MTQPKRARFLIVSELPTIRELIGSVNTNAFTTTYPRNVL